MSNLHLVSITGHFGRNDGSRNFLFPINFPQALLPVGSMVEKEFGGKNFLLEVQAYRFNADSGGIVVALGMTDMQSEADKEGLVEMLLDLERDKKQGVKQIKLPQPED